MKYYIPTSSLNFNNILSTESVSPKVFYEKRGFGYSRWQSVDENNIEHLTLLYDSPHIFERPKSDIEDHPMLVEIDVDETYPQIAEGVFYSDKTIYINPWQARFIFFSEKDKTIALSLSDSSLETKLVRLYKKKICVLHFDGAYPHVPINDSIPQADCMDDKIEEDYVINKMKGLLYGYYIGANISSSKELVQDLDVLREIKNIFSSVLSSYDKSPSNKQSSRLNELFGYIDSRQPIFAELEQEVGDVEKIISILARHGIKLPFIDRTKLIYGLQIDGDNNQSVAWANHEIARVKALMSSSNIKLNPDDGEVIVSSKDKLVNQKAETDELKSTLLFNWINEVLCSKSFNGKISSIKEPLSDEITKCAKRIMGAEWETSSIRVYLNQLRRHVRGEEFNQTWDNGVLSSMAAVLIKGDEWNLLLDFMQNKSMYDYRIAFAMYGVLNGFANLTRDFTDLLLTKEYSYLSKVYREFYGQLLERSIPEISVPIVIEESSNPHVEGNNPLIGLKKSGEKSLADWQNEIREFAASVIKRDKKRLLSSLDEAFIQNGSNQDYFVFITMLDNFDGWKPSKNNPSTAWKRLQENFVPDYNQRIGKPSKKQSATKTSTSQERGLFDDLKHVVSNVSQSIKSVISGEDRKEDNMHESITYDNVTSVGVSVGISILDDPKWINECTVFISDSRAKSQFVDDMEWFVDNHNDIYYDKKKGQIPGYYAGKERNNERVFNRLKAYIENKRNPQNPNMKWLAEIYQKVPVDKILDYISKKYGI